MSIGYEASQVKLTKMRQMPNKRKFWIISGLLLSCAATTYILLSRLDLVMPLSQITVVLCIPSCGDRSPIHTPIANNSYLNSDKSLTELLGEAIEPKKVSFLVEKSRHRVTVFYDLEPVKAYESVFGTSPTGDKRIEGDRKTPEGIFRIRDLYPHDDWSKFIWLDYPTPQSWRKHFRAKLSGEIGLLSTIGGQIGIHGVPDNADGFVDTRSNWTWGCVSLKNADVDEIYSVAAHDTIVEIVP
ncbi:MAG: L,D-transpeptidase [Cyanobacteria bacterium J06560_6]